MPDEEGELVDRLLAGDESAFEQLVGRYQERLRRLARAFVRSDAAADDVVQETWLAVLRGLPRFERRSTLRTWIFHILANRARTQAVRDAKRVLFPELAAGEAEEPLSPDRDWFDAKGGWREPPRPWRSHDPERLLLDHEIREALEHAVETLPPGQRTVVILRDIEGLTAEEACNILGISETNQRVLLHRGRTRIRRALAPLLDRPERR